MKTFRIDQIQLFFYKTNFHPLHQDIQIYRMHKDSRSQRPMTFQVHRAKKLVKGADVNPVYIPHVSKLFQKNTRASSQILYSSQISYGEKIKSSGILSGMFMAWRETSLRSGLMMIWLAEVFHSAGTSQR